MKNNLNIPEKNRIYVGRGTVRKKRCYNSAFGSLFADERLVFIAHDRSFQYSISFSRGFQKLRICTVVYLKKKKNKNTQIVTALIKVRQLKPRLKPTRTDWATRRENSLRGPVMGPRRFRSIFCKPNYVLLVWIGYVSRSHCTAFVYTPTTIGIHSFGTLNNIPWRNDSIPQKCSRLSSQSEWSFSKRDDPRHRRSFTIH